MHSSAFLSTLVCVSYRSRRTPKKNFRVPHVQRSALASGQPQVMQQAIKQSKQFVAGCRSCKSCVFSSKLSHPIQTKVRSCLSVFLVACCYHIYQSIIQITDASHCCYCVSSTGLFCCERAAASAPLRRLLTFGRGVRARQSMRCSGV